MAIGCSYRMNRPCSSRSCTRTGSCCGILVWDSKILVVFRLIPCSPIQVRQPAARTHTSTVILNLPAPEQSILGHEPFVRYPPGCQRWYALVWWKKEHRSTAPDPTSHLAESSMTMTMTTTSTDTPQTLRCTMEIPLGWSRKKNLRPRPSYRRRPPRGRNPRRLCNGWPRRRVSPFLAHEKKKAPPPSSRTTKLEAGREDRTSTTTMTTMTTTTTIILILMIGTTTTLHSNPMDIHIRYRHIRRLGWPDTRQKMIPWKWKPILREGIQFNRRLRLLLRATTTGTATMMIQ